MLSNLSVKDPEVKVKVVHSPFVIRLNITAKVVTPKIGKELQYNNSMKIKFYELEISELKRLIKDSWLNPQSEYYSQSKEEVEAATKMLAELDKLTKFNGSVEDARKLVDVEVFQPVHSWAFFFTSLMYIGYDQLHQDVVCEDFIRLTLQGVTLAKIPIDL